MGDRARGGREGGERGARGGREGGERGARGGQRVRGNFNLGKGREGAIGGREGDRGSEEILSWDTTL